MIKSKEDYLFYLKSDEIALGISENRFARYKSMMMNPIWKYERLLRQAEYFSNCFHGTLFHFLATCAKVQAYRYGYKLGFEIPINVFGPGLSIAHHGSVIVNPYSNVGENCRIHNSVTIGTEAGYGDRCPSIGNNIYILALASEFLVR